MDGFVVVVVDVAGLDVGAGFEVGVDVVGLVVVGAGFAVEVDVVVFVVGAEVVEVDVVGFDGCAAVLVGVAETGGASF